MRQGHVPGVDDGLEAVQSGEGARASLLGEEQRGAPARMPEPVGAHEPEVVDNGEHVEGEAVPVEVRIGGRVRRSMGTLVEGDGVELSAQVGGQGPEGRAAKSRGVGEQERGTVPAEVVVGDAHPV